MGSVSGQKAPVLVILVVTTDTLARSCAGRINYLFVPGKAARAHADKDKVR